MAKFKKGDRVKCLVSEFGNETVGKIYTVAYSDHVGISGWFGVEKDDDGIANSYNENNFELECLDGCPIKDEFKTKEKTMTINYTLLNESIVLNYDRKTIVVASGDERFEEVLACIREDRLQDIPGIVEIERRYDGDGLKLVDGVLHVNSEPMPIELSDHILKFRSQKLPYDALLRFWTNLKQNPSFNARKALFKFLQHNGHPITSDGCFIAYRGVRDDFKDKHTGKWDNSPGSVCEMDRNNVDDNPNNTCSTGLHVACFDYARGFGEKLIEVKVNPLDVVCVPTDYNGTKMRVCRFEVIAECAEINGSLLKKVESESDDELPSLDYCDQCGEDTLDAWGECENDCYNREEE